MPKYRYECPICKRIFLRFKRIENIDVPEYCVHGTHIPMTRLFHASFQIIANREQDKDENKLYKILTKGSGATDELALMRKDEKRYEEEMNNMPEIPKPMTAEDILNTGVIEASRTPEGLKNWRDKHVSDKWNLPTAPEATSA